jgi:hypothetical protein
VVEQQGPTHRPEPYLAAGSTGMAGSSLRLRASSRADLTRTIASEHAITTSLDLVLPARTDRVVDA